MTTLLSSTDTPMTDLAALITSQNLVMVRHGQSLWNLENRFTGWADVPLTEQGIAEAKRAAEILKQAGYKFDLAYTSYLSRAQHTLRLILETLDQVDIPVVLDWRLNERHYGGLTGLNKAETVAQYGEAQVKIWRRSYDIEPPLPTTDLSEFPGFDARYETFGDVIPKTESLKTTLDRVMPLWFESILPDLQAGKRVLIAAHGNSLRALIKYISNLTDAEILEVELPTGTPFCFEPAAGGSASGLLHRFL